MLLADQFPYFVTRRDDFYCVRAGKYGFGLFWCLLEAVRLGDQILCFVIQRAAFDCARVVKYGLGLFWCLPESAI